MTYNQIQRKSWRMLPLAAVATVAAIALAACGSSGSSGGGSSAGGSSAGGSAPASQAATNKDVAAGAPAPPASLLAQAKQEGKLTIYTSIASAGLTTGIQQAFNKAYPSISVQFLSEGSTEVTGRYATEAKAGAVQADDVLTGYSGFYPQMLSAGYMLPTASVIPGFASIYPTAGTLDNGQIGVVFEIPNGLAYNTNLVSGANIPTSFADFAKPYWKGHLLAFNPSASPAFLQFWDMVLKVYGPTVVKEIGQNIIPDSEADTLPPAAQSLAAGEGYAALLMPQTTTEPLVSSGAPIKFVLPSTATGPQYVLGVSAKGPDPAAAKLFAYWAYSRTGQAALTAVNSSIGALTGDTKGFYAPNNDISASEQAQILSLLGKS
jgi:iron(III) transport system substrate-binding protein